MNTPITDKTFAESLLISGTDNITHHYSKALEQLEIEYTELHGIYTTHRDTLAKLINYCRRIGISHTGIPSVDSCLREGLVVNEGSNTEQKL